MKETIRSGGSVATVRPENSRRAKKRTNPRCSICMQRTWFTAIPLMEPVGAPDPRLSWILCQRCYGELLTEMRRSPVRSPLRLRIAMGLVAAERSPQAYPLDRPRISDRTWILVISWGFVIAMIIHLILIVMIAFVAK